MEAELRKAPASYRMSMLSKVRNYKRDIEQLTADVVCYVVLITLHCNCLSFSFSALHFFVFACVNIFILHCWILGGFMFVQRRSMTARTGATQPQFGFFDEDEFQVCGIYFTFCYMYMVLSSFTLFRFRGL